MATQLGKHLLGLVAVGFLGTAIGCAVENTLPTIDPTDVDGGVFDEKRIYATLDGSALMLDVVLGNPDSTQIGGVAVLTLRSLDESKLAEVKKTFSYSEKGNTLHITLGDLPSETTRSDLVAYRIDYDVAWNGGRARGTRSVYDALRKIEVVLFAENKVDDAGKADFSLFTLDPSTGEPISNASVNVTLVLADGQEITTATQTDEYGKANGSIDVPENSQGDATLKVSVVGNDVETVEEIAVRIERRQKILVTTDKPMYQPSQTMHIRALALRTSDKKPVANSDLIFEIEDAKGNKIAREQTKTDEYGIASIPFKLAHEVNMGNWVVRAIVDGTTTEKTVKVDRYTLPKFKTTVDLNKTWYKPGDTVQITGEVRYFFGKPVSGGTVEVTASTFDIDFTPFQTTSTSTNEEGLFSLEFTVPNYVVGQTLEQGKGMLKLDLAVTDTAGQQQTLSKAAPIAEGAVEVSLIPESGDLALGMSNDIYVVTTDPNGGAVQAMVLIKDTDDVLLAEIQTNEQGMGTFYLTPNQSEITLNVEATAGEDFVKVSRTLASGGHTESVLLRADKTLYEVGDTALLEARVGTDLERVFLDMVQDGKTIDVRTLDILDGKAVHMFDIDNTMEGEIMASVYYLTTKGHIIRDQKKIYVRPSNELSVTLSAPEATYLPGELAKVDVEVVDRAGQGVPAAVGVNIVDEAVFALQEVQPGLLKTFFQLAKELAEPRVHVKGPAGYAAGLLFNAPEEEDETFNETAKVAFAALGDEPQHSIEIDTYKAEVSEMLAALKPWTNNEKKRIQDELGELADMGVVTWENIEFFMNSQFEVGNDLWQQPYTMSVDTDSERITIRSAGPDERTDTMDDYEFTLDYWNILYGDDMMFGAEAAMDQDGDGPPNAGGGPPQPDPAGPNNKSASGEAGVKVRDYFPETLYVNPAVITGPSGFGSFEVEMADSITEWRMTGLASSQNGLLGSGTGGITVFQEFFVDIDFPVSITRNDRFSVPVAIYNYLDKEQTVSLTVEDAEWVNILGSDTKTVTLAPGEVTGTSFEIEAGNVGLHGLTIVAIGETMSDAVKRTVEVKPDGKEFTSTVSARLPSSTDPSAPAQATITKNFVVPDANIDGSQKLLVKVYPGFMSQVVEGMESMLRLPGG
jgi:hypothetical protein